jgi:N-methylhydantoinase B
MGAPMAVISGRDFRHDGEPYVNQIFIGKNGGPGSPHADGWVTYVLPNAGGVTYRDSIELDELKHPIHIHLQRLAIDTGGAGRFRGAPSAEVIYSARGAKMTVIIPSDGHHNPPQGVRGGEAGAGARTYWIDKLGDWSRQPNVCTIELEQGEKIYGRDCGGGGYGDPLTREPARVREDVAEGWVSARTARETYGVKIEVDESDFGFAVDEKATNALRKQLLRKQV